MPEQHHVAILGAVRPLRAILDALHEVVAILSLDGRVIEENGGLSGMLGMSPRELQGACLTSLVAGDEAGPLRQAIAQAAQGTPARVPARLRRLALPPVRRRLSLCVAEVGGGRVLVLTADEPPTTSPPVHATARPAAAPAGVSVVDGLTRLPKRRAILQQLAGMLARAMTGASASRHVAVLQVDVDHFKKVNDSIGHDVGDLLLQAVAGRLTELVAASDADGPAVARSGDDEFTVLLPLDDDRVTVFAQELQGTVSQPYTLAGHDLFVSASVGVAVYPTDGADAESLLKNADTALYRAKSAGRNRVSAFRHVLGGVAVRQLLLENELRRAIERDELTLHFQPRVNLQTGEVKSAEALVRWMHPERGMVSPGEFIPLAEETGLIVPLGNWVLRTAARQSAAWVAMGCPIRVAVNISGREFYEPNFVETVVATVRDAGAEIRHMELEVTETLAMEDAAVATRVLSELHSLGFYLALDDFGTGYSSITYLTQFPFNALKLDRSYIAPVAQDPRLAGIVNVLIGLAMTLGLEVVAEGIEDEEQVSFLRDLRCDEAQGFLFSRPITAEQFTERYIAAPTSSFLAASPSSPAEAGE